jgi:hypothetical protein
MLVLTDEGGYGHGVELRREGMDDIIKWMIQEDGWPKKMDGPRRWMVQEDGWSKKMDGPRRWMA